MRNITIHRADDWTLGLTVLFETNFTNKRVLARLHGGWKVKEFERWEKIEDIWKYNGPMTEISREDLMSIVDQGDKSFWTYDGFIGGVQGFAAAQKRFGQQY